MKISIKTGGPITDLPTFLHGRKETLMDMITAISDEIDDSQAEYREQIQEAILAAIRFCARENFYFNSHYESTFATSRGQSAYGEETCKDIAHCEALLTVSVLQDTTPPRRLKTITKANYDRLTQAERSSGGAPSLGSGGVPSLDLASIGLNVLPSGPLGLPECYAYCDKKLFLFPCPDTAYLIHLSLSSQRLEEIVRYDQQSPWFTEAFDMVKARAKYELYKNIFQDMSAASLAYKDFQEHARLLQEETSRRSSTSFIKSTRF